MFWRITKTVLILPGTVLVYIPLLIQWMRAGWPFGGGVGSVWELVIAVCLAVPAIALARKTIMLFVHEGDGTPAPWDPPRKFVVSGPYRHMRNPMLTAVIVLILAEAVALHSAALLGWALVFFLLNTVYFIFSEEPALARRFGASYLQYKAVVPRWVPRVRPYRASAETVSRLG